jgi:TRAP-type C4-dicarboxylate transport system permease large subunit
MHAGHSDASVIGQNFPPVFLAQVCIFFGVTISSISSIYSRGVAPGPNLLYPLFLQMYLKLPKTGCSESPRTLRKQVVTQLFVIVQTSS